MKCSSMPMRTVTVVSGIGRYNEMFSRLSSNFPAGPSSRRWSSPSLWVVWACQGAGPGPRLWPAHLLAPPPAPSQCRGWPGWRPQVTPWSQHIICIPRCQAPGAWLWAGRCRPHGSRWAWPSRLLSDSELELGECFVFSLSHRVHHSALTTDQVTPGNKRRAGGSFEDCKLQSLSFISSDDWYNR